jgi:hypothetical protein
MAEDACPDVGDDRPPAERPNARTIPRRSGEDAGSRSAEDHIERLEVFFAERVVDQELRLSGMTLNSVSIDADADNASIFLSSSNGWMNARSSPVRRRLHASGRRVLIVLIVVDVGFVILVVIGRNGAAACRQRFVRRAGTGRQLLLEFRRSRSSRNGLRIIR